MASVDEIQARHRRELRELQGRITNKKKNATKKTRKGVNDECAALEQALRERHAEELRAAASGTADTADTADGGDVGSDDVDGVAAQLADSSLHGDAADAAAGTSTAEAVQGGQQPGPPPGPKRNRQKERLARRAAELEAQAARAADEASHMVDHAAAERAAMAPLIAQSGRVEHPIRPDGHCLFSAVADQMAEVGRELAGGGGAAAAAAELPPFRAVRHAAARYMAAHPDDFAPFLLGGDAHDGGGAHDGDPLATHIAQIRDTAEWGGQLELAALASAYDVDIRVLHDGRSELIRPAGGEDGGDGRPARPTLWLVYYRHGFGLGEHYNSLRARAAAAA